MKTYFIEAESFSNCGGWVIDQQFMDIMGSPYLLAHGMGTPVEDATTMITIKPGSYHVWVRTKEWSRCNDSSIAPGRFELKFNGIAIPHIFGTKNEDWHWEYAKKVDITSSTVNLSLHDLTGFNGRCDAIVLTSDSKITPPSDKKELDFFRRKLLGFKNKKKETLQYDLVVIGGGFAGLGSAISAARCGLKVAIVQDRPLVGGNNSSEVRVQLGGLIHQPPYQNLGNIVDELDPHFRQNARDAYHYNDELKMSRVLLQEGLTPYLSYRAVKTEMNANKILSVTIRSITSGKEIVLKAPIFADCTGDGTIGAMAGADYRYGREARQETSETLAPAKSDRMTMGSSIMWYSAKQKIKNSFPQTPWAIQFDDKNYQKVIRGDWNWEFGLHRDQIEDSEWIRDYALKVIYGNWSYLKHNSKEKEEYEWRKLAWVSYILGKRESRRLLGDVILSQKNIENKEKWSDSCVTTTWSIDLHYPIYSKYYHEEPFRTIARKKKITPFAIPYRCFYSRNIKNLFMAGRNISVTHAALGTVRVMRTCGLMGEVVGIASSICKEKGCTPKNVYEKYLDLLKEKLIKGVPHK